MKKTKEKQLLQTVQRTRAHSKDTLLTVEQFAFDMNVKFIQNRKFVIQGSNLDYDCMYYIYA